MLASLFSRTILTLAGGLIAVGAAAQPPGGAPAAPGEVALPPLLIEGAAPGSLPPAAPGGQVATGGRLGLLGNTVLMDQPVSTTSYTAQTIEDRQARSLGDVLALEPSVRVTSLGGGPFDALFLRGFPLGEGNVGEFAFDGLFGVAPNYRILTDYVERIEVLRGPAAFLYGVSPNGAVGGVINIVPRRAQEDLTRVTADYASRSQVGGHLDLARRFGDNREFGVRFNGSYRDGDTPPDNQSRSAGVGALSLDYRGERLRTSLDLIWQNESLDAPSRPYLLANGVAVPGAPGGRRNITQPWEFSRLEDRSALFRAEYDLAPGLTVFGGIGGSETELDRLFGTPTITNARGDTLVTPQRFLFEVSRHSYEAGLRARFETGAVRHAVTLQASRYHDSLDRGSRNGTAITSNIHAPILRPAQSVGLPASAPRVSDSDLTGIALADTLSILDDRLALTLGIRHQQVQARNYGAGGVVSSRYDESAVTPFVGLVVRPWRNLSLYANYAEGLARGDIAPVTATNAAEVLAPYRTRQYEAGLRVELGAATATLALFQITKPSGEISGGVFAANGEQRVRGIEAAVFGEAAEGLRLLGGVTLLDAELTRTAVAANVGNRPVGIPSVQANLGIEWDLPWVRGLTFGGTLIQTGRQPVDTANTRSLPAWITLDLSLRYATTVADRPTTFRAGVYNLFDANYWSGVATFGTIAQGAPRRFLVSMTVDL